MIKRIAEMQEQLQLLAEDKKHATIPGKEDLPLLEVVRRNELVVLGTLRSFLDDLYEIDPTSCSCPLRPSPSCRLKALMSHIKKMLVKRR